MAFLSELGSEVLDPVIEFEVAAGQRHDVPRLKTLLKRVPAIEEVVGEKGYGNIAPDHQTVGGG